MRKVNESLIPCRFCGNKDENKLDLANLEGWSFEPLKGGGWITRIVCLVCGAMGPAANDNEYSKAVEKAEKLWNDQRCER